MKAAARTDRKADHPIEPIFLDRWSPRAMSGETIEVEELMTLFEAARWAPSSYNNQPWRFIYARRDTEAWPTLLGLLDEKNRSWAKDAAALVVICSHRLFDYNGKPSRTHTYDAGCAWGYLALQGSIRGLVVHGMQGFDYERARRELQVPQDYDVEAMTAIGLRGDPDKLPPGLREMEAPSGRKRLTETVFEGRFDARPPR